MMWLKISKSKLGSSFLHLKSDLHICQRTPFKVHPPLSHQSRQLDVGDTWMGGARCNGLAMIQSKSCAATTSGEKVPYEKASDSNCNTSGGSPTFSPIR